MKYIKILGLAAMAAMAIMALGAGSASATELCTDTGCTVKYPKDTVISATSGHTRLVATFGTVTCTTNEIEGKTSNAGGASETVKGPVSFLNFDICNGTVNELANGELEVHTVNTHLGTLTSKGAKVTTSLFGVHCVWGTGAGTHLGSVTGGSTPTVHIKATVEKIEGSAFCGSTATWEGTYTVHKPHALYFK